MSEMMEALQALAAEKGISVDTLMAALADALESAYKRMPGAHEYAWVTIDPANFDIRVYAQEIDEDGEPYGPRARRHPQGLRSHRGPDGAPGHDPAHPRGRA
jgi:uncharacterized protein YigE (DUF2233 family)